MKSSSEIKLLLDNINEAYSKKAWHGPNLRGSIRGLTAKEAARRPRKDRHNIWEIVVHCAYWKYIVRRRILGEKKGSFPLKGSNWFKRPDGKLINDAWRRDVRLLNDMHCMLIDAVAQLQSAHLNNVPHGSKVNNRAIISGIAMHDVYHAGQIQLIKRMM
jgi:hypothetical protein